MGWYAIRTVYLFGVKSDDTNVFEERIVVFEASSWSEALSKAHVESDEYVKHNGFVAHPEKIGYEQDGDKLIDGYEIWSELFEHRSSLEEFYAMRYGQYEYRPEDFAP